MIRCSEKQAESHLVLDTHRCLRAYLDAPEHDADHSDAVTRLLRLQHIGGQLSSAVAHLHALCIIHRDLKPQNIMLDRFGTVRILDFGIALLKSEPNLDHSIRGTMAYMAPEQISNEEG